MVMESWATDELRHADLGDRRLNQRLIKIVENLAAHPESSVPQASGTWAETKATYRFWDLKQVTPEAIRRAHTQSTGERVEACSTVLVVQDTTNLDFSHHPATTGLGYLDHVHMKGLKVHSALAVSGLGVPLGLVHQEVWTRDYKDLGKKPHRRCREIEEKESQRWLTALQATQEALPDGVRVVTVADQEADIYDLMAAPRRTGHELLIRGCRDRRVGGEVPYLWDAMRSKAVQGRYTLSLRGKEGSEARDAVLTVRYGTVEIQPPHHHKRRAQLRPIRLSAVLVEEEGPPPDLEPVCWLLLTTLAVDSLDAAKQVILWYSYRWLIERYHYVFKSGCHIEKLQLETAERIQRALATYCVVAWRLLWLTYEARRRPDVPCNQVLSDEEWHCLFRATHPSSTLPDEPPTLHQAVRWIAQLGGFLGRTRDGEPGVKTIWRGLRRLADIMIGWTIARSQSPHLTVSYG
jgi:hypothetical protein